MPPQVSVIIATYNSAKTVRAALESVKKQKFQDWECVVVDGASKDETMSIVQEYVKADARFSCLSEPDKGIYDAFNKGWKRAKGVWVHYLGSDDKLTENSFCELLEKPVDDDVVVLSGSAYIEKTDGSLGLQPSDGWKGCHQAKLTRRDVLERMHGFDEQYKILADLELYIRMKTEGYKVKNFEQPVCYFALDGVSQKFRGIWGRQKECIKVLRKDADEKHPVLRSMSFMLHTILACSYRKIIRLLHTSDFRAKGA